MTARVAGSFAFFAGLLSLGACGAKPDDLPALRVPPGFHVAVWAQDIPGARSLALGPGGTVFVGTRQGTDVLALADRDGDGRAEERHVVARGLDTPNGVAFHDGALFIGERTRIVRLDDIEKHLADPPAPVVVRGDLPDTRGHSDRVIAFGPDGRLYVALGAPCNVCEPGTFERDGRTLQLGSISRMDADGRHWEMVATGVRNSVGMAWRPGDPALWFTDNGRDNLGDDQPSCELNRSTAPGQDFGFPYCHQGDLPDPDFGKPTGCDGFVPPVLKLGAHVAPLGLRFYTGTLFPPAYRGAAFVAEHGSWNRSHKVGYRVVAVHIGASGSATQDTVIDGWMVDEKVSGRPVDVLPLPDGSLLVSDDLKGRIYRLSYAGR